MSGHSKWSSIKHKKGAADAKRGKLFSKLSRAIIVAAREGGADPADNIALQNAIEKARELLDAEGQHRARDRARAPTPTRDAFETVVYEGYGPSGVAVLVEALTDNRNRTASEVRHIFSEARRQPRRDGRGRVAVRAPGVVLVDADGVDEDELMLAAADGGADDVELDGSSSRSPVEPEALAAVRGRSRRPGSTVEWAELTMLPKTTVEVEDEATRAEGPPPDGRPGGQRRRPGRLRELRHPGAGARSPVPRRRGSGSSLSLRRSRRSGNSSSFTCSPSQGGRHRERHRHRGASAQRSGRRASTCRRAGRSAASRRAVTSRLTASFVTMTPAVSRTTSTSAIRAGRRARRRRRRRRGEAARRGSGSKRARRNTEPFTSTEQGPLPVSARSSSPRTGTRRRARSGSAGRCPGREGRLAERRRRFRWASS